MKRVAIIGAGAGGLAAAYDLARAGRQVAVYESDDHVGGLASGFKQPNWDWSVERYYHHWFASDKHILGLIDELGWSERVIFPRPVTVVYHDEQFYPLDSPVAVLRFPGIPFPDRLRVGAVVAYLRYVARWEPLEQVTAHEWLSARVGARAYSSIWEPLLVGKFGPHYKEVNMAWFWARIKARTPRLGTYEGGFQAFMDDLADQVRSEGAEIRLQTPVEGIQPTNDQQLEVRLEGELQAFDDCLVTTSPALLAQLAPGLPGPYLQGLKEMKSMGAVVMVLSLKHRLSEQGHYWHNLPKAGGFPFLSLVEHTNFLSPVHFGGEHIVYCGDYLDPDHEYFELSQFELLERFVPALNRINSSFEPEWINTSWLYRTPYAQPIPPINHSQSIPDLQTPV
ncbi:MAG: NAD(P)/FAD-dependent oxidoreductase, partial [Anaerolineales bacterium]